MLVVPAVDTTVLALEFVDRIDPAGLLRDEAARGQENGCWRRRPASAGRDCWWSSRIPDRWCRWPAVGWRVEDVTEVSLTSSLSSLSSFFTASTTLPQMFHREADRLLIGVQVGERNRGYRGNQGVMTPVSWTFFQGLPVSSSGLRLRLRKARWRAQKPSMCRRFITLNLVLRANRAGQTADGTTADLDNSRLDNNETACMDRAGEQKPVHANDRMKGENSHIAKVLHGLVGIRLRRVPTAWRIRPSASGEIGELRFNPLGGIFCMNHLS